MYTKPYQKIIDNNLTDIYILELEDSRDNPNHEIIFFTLGVIISNIFMLVLPEQLDENYLQDI